LGAGPANPVLLTPSATSGDANRQAFSQTLTGLQGPNTIIVTAVSVGTPQVGSQIVSQTLHVSCDIRNVPPAIVCPAAVTNACGSVAGARQTLTAPVSDPDDPPLPVPWSVEGALVRRGRVALSSGVGPDSLSYPFADAKPLVQVPASDGFNPPVSCTTTV